MGAAVQERLRKNIWRKNDTIIWCRGTVRWFCQVLRRWPRIHSPLSAYEKEKLLDSVAYVCRTYLEKYPDHNLDTWSKPDCEAYLRAKSTQIILQFQPDYYRAYAVPEIRRYGHDFMGPYFLLTYYYDRTKDCLLYTSDAADD